jgi:hypothetical protein
MSCFEEPPSTAASPMQAIGGLEAVPERGPAPYVGQGARRCLTCVGNVLLSATRRPSSPHMRPSLQAADLKATTAKAAPNRSLPLLTPYQALLS